VTAHELLTVHLGVPITDRRRHNMFVSQPQPVDDAVYVARHRTPFRPGGAPLQPVPGARSALAGSRANQDSALVAW